MESLHKFMAGQWTAVWVQQSPCSSCRMLAGDGDGPIWVRQSLQGMWSQLQDNLANAARERQLCSLRAAMCFVAKPIHLFTLKV